ncbi:hypothetical protein HDK64DRAFT_315114 [Phyllosticta capitalensis]
MGDLMDGVDIHIRVNGQRLKEYVDEDDENPPRTVVKYIVAESGAHFTVAHKFDHSFKYQNYDILLSVYLDGHRAYDAVLHKEDFHTYAERPHGEITASRSFKDGRFWERNFTFAELVIDESGEKFNANKKKSIDALGEISVKLFRVKVTSKAEQPKGDEMKDFEKQKRDAKVPEKALKGRAVSHQAKLGQLQAGRSYKSVTTHNIDPEHAPLALCSFRYRSKEALQSMYLIPRTPEPIPLEDRPIEDLTAEEMRELLRRQKEQLDRATTIKKESRNETTQLKRDSGYQGSWEDGDDLAITEDRQAKRHKKNSEIETVDLTGD